MNDLYAGIDLGGTNIKFGLFSSDGSLLEKWMVPTGDRSEEAVFSKIAEEITTHLCMSGCDVKNIQGIGMGVPGAVDETGMLLNAPNLGWTMTDCRERLGQWLDVPLYAANDANVAALGEQAYGTGSDCRSLVFVTLGTGVGGGVIVDGKLVAGCFGGAGEIGHMVVNLQETNKCSCGHCGCLEQYVSATGIVRMTKLRLRGTKLDSVLRAVDNITAKDVFDAVRQEDELAVLVAEDFGRILGRALALVSAVTDPEMFVIGGGVSAAGEILLDYVRRYYRKYAFTPSVNTPIKLAQLGNDAGIYGAARLAMNSKL